jgi:hypothetical protein
MIDGLSLYLDNGREIRSDAIPVMLKKIGPRFTAAFI